MPSYNFRPKNIWFVHETGIKRMKTARRCSKYSGKAHKHCIRYKNVRVATAKGIRQGKSFYHGDRIKKANWGSKRWARARLLDRARSGKKYESWERNRRLSWK